MLPLIAAFQWASCSRLIVVAAGYYDRSRFPHVTSNPIIGSRQDGGYDWIYPSTIVSAVPTNFEQESFQ